MVVWGFGVGGLRLGLWGWGLQAMGFGACGVAFLVLRVALGQQRAGSPKDISPSP
mgnify:CR=1 FL=1